MLGEIQVPQVQREAVFSEEGREQVEPLTVPQNRLQAKTCEGKQHQEHQKKHIEVIILRRLLLRHIPDRKNQAQQLDSDRKGIARFRKPRRRKAL